MYFIEPIYLKVSCPFNKVVTLGECMGANFSLSRSPLWNFPQLDFKLCQETSLTINYIVIIFSKSKFSLIYLLTKD